MAALPIIISHVNFNSKGSKVYLMSQAMDEIRRTHHEATTTPWAMP